MLKARAKGFTLIELVIVVAIVAILAAIALPSYLSYMQKSRRAQAKADLTEIAQELERQYTIQRTYVGYALPFAVSPRESASGGGVTAYNLAGDIAARAYTLKAAATGPQSSDYCGDLTLDQTGTKHHSTNGDDDICNWGTQGP
jgi:type IV pilus assembly protein PilE